MKRAAEEICTEGGCDYSLCESCYFRLVEEGSKRLLSNERNEANADEQIHTAACSLPPAEMEHDPSLQMRVSRPTTSTAHSLHSLAQQFEVQAQQMTQVWYRVRDLERMLEEQAAEVTQLRQTVRRAAELHAEEAVAAQHRALAQAAQAEQLKVQAQQL